VGQDTEDGFTEHWGVSSFYYWMDHLRRR